MPGDEHPQSRTTGCRLDEASKLADTSGGELPVHPVLKDQLSPKGLKRRVYLDHCR
ncbi:hypothetical protein GCM10027280_05330 [Micromonospora polyrhachis]